MTTATRTPAPPARPPVAPPRAPTPAAPPPTQQFAQKLISADLDAERTRAQALLAEATREQASSPRRAAQLEAEATAHLTAIAAEQATRQSLGRATLPDGTTGTQLAASLRTTPDDALKALAALKGSSPETQLKRTTATRELDRRAAIATSIQQQFERTRLDTLKRDFAKSLEGKGPKDLRAAQREEHQALGQAERALDLAKAQLASATTPGDRANAQQLVSSAERTLRSEYSKAAVVDTLAPPKLDHQALHDYANTLKGQSVASLEQEKAAIAARLADGTTGAVRMTREQRAMDTVKQAIVDQAIARAQGAATPTPVKGPAPVKGGAPVKGTAPVSAVDRTRNPGNVVFDGSGAMVADAAAFPASQYAAKLKAAGVTYVTLQINNGGPNTANISQLDHGWADQWKAAGFKVGYWGVSYKDTENDARQAAQLTAKYKGDFYIADCEGSFQQGEGDISRNKLFAESFQDEATKQGIGNIPRALSSMGRVALDMKPWIDGGWDAMPQAYWNSYEHYQPSKCVQFYEDSGWPKDRIHPTIATYDGSSEGNARPKSLAEYGADLKAAGTTGFSYYLPENYLDDAGYEQLGAMIHGT